MTRTTIRRIAALPLSLAIIGIALIALSALPASENEEPTAHAANAPVVDDVDANVQND